MKTSDYAPSVVFIRPQTDALRLPRIQTVDATDRRGGKYRARDLHSHQGDALHILGAPAESYKPVILHQHRSGHIAMRSRMLFHAVANQAGQR